MSPKTFTDKQLRFTFVLSNNAKFAGTNSNKLVLTGLRASVQIRGSGLPAFPEAEITVYGMLQADMVALTALAFQTLTLQRNTVTVEANSGQGWSTAFAGQIITAGPDYAATPSVSLRITARVLGFESLNPATPASYTGDTSVATIVSNIAAKMGRVMENNGVAVNLSNPYFGGTLTDQLRAVADHSGIDVYTPPDQNVVAICPKGTPRQQPTFVLSPTSGLVGYPVLDYNRGFVQTRAVYNAAFRFGGPIEVQNSQVLNANGKWVIGTLTHSLECNMPGGAWFSELLLYPPGSLPPSS